MEAVVVGSSHGSLCKDKVRDRDKSLVAPTLIVR